MDVKAQIFSIIAILMSFLFILIFSGAMHIPLDKDVTVMSSTVDNVDTLINQLEYIVKSESRLSTYRILESFSQYSAGTTPIVNPRNSFLQCFLTGNSAPVDCKNTINGNDISLPYYLDNRFSDAENIYNVDISYNIIDSSFDQVSAYSVQTNVTLFVSVSKNGYLWNKTVVSSQEVTILGITDPLSLKNNPNGRNFERKFVVRPTGSPPGNIIQVSRFKNNYSDMLNDFIDAGYYFKDVTGPSFFEMLELDLPNDISGSNSLGISSFVPPVNSNGQSMYIQNLPVVVYQYVQPGIFTLTEPELRRIKTPIHTNSIFMHDYLVDVMGGVRDNSALLLVQGCCDGSGCTPGCGEY